MWRTLVAVSFSITFSGPIPNFRASQWFLNQACLTMGMRGSGCFRQRFDSAGSDRTLCPWTTVDENASGEVAPLLAYLRELQRRYGVAVVVVHHAKRGAGQALRGSSEFHAWGDSNLYLRRNGGPHERGDITLTVEHRAAPAMPALTLELAQRENALALEVIERRTPQTPPPSSVDERIAAALRAIRIGTS